ncbi:WD repeat-containing protein 19 isoform X3 [Tribolium castaneum]|uniref:WD repeat-containing protein 19-like Protein n=2 Tax=Tribolium castaneum TaxID=7070 RepID=D2A3G8_TRICA|nr:PREDICTED: WD repeat-containing protein 19 isoform X3 [Tribolium castaneum]EFA01913.1 WD repeat-containing protein 19-like Protein [Tribolium castaneum]|eukprot:XP_015834561.1 PREDICTED: WD repeat-containing protein 19 isoform X3 [Tribolium castaneum]
MGSEKLLFRLEQPHGTGDIYTTWQNGSGMYLATTGIDCMVNIFDRYGQIQDRIRLPSLCTGFGWDSDGDLLAVICQSPQLTLWDANTQKKIQIDVRLKDQMSCVIWAKTAPMLAVGTVKGNISIYNHNTSKRTPVIGKHAKKITCGAWNTENLLALGSEDKTISISNVDGDTLRVINLRAEPSEINFSEMKLDERMGGENTVSVIVGKRTLYLYNLLDPDNPIELAFQQHYGSIVTYKWFGDGYILIGFNAGYFIAISTHIKEVGQELFQVRNHKNTLTDITINDKIGKAASCGDNNVKIHDLSNLQETSSVLTLSQEAGLERISWSVDGQLFSVCTRGGSLNVYLSHVPLLTSVSTPRIAILSSLTEISLYNYSSEKTKYKPIPITLETEPSFIAVGPYHIAAGLNNRVWFYDLTRPQPGVDDAPLMLKDRQYLGGVTSIKLNPEYASVLFEGKLQLHMIEQPEVCHEDRETIMFPNANSPNLFITCHFLTTDFLIYGTDMGNIVYFHVEEWALAHEYKHEVGIVNVFADPAGTRLVFVDIKGQGYVYNAVINEVVLIPNLPNKVLGVTWDSNINDRNIFIVYDQHDIFTYVYVRYSINGSSVQKVGQTSLVTKQIPLLMYSGEVISATPGGQITQLILNTHDSPQIGVNEHDQTIQETNFNKQIALYRFSAAWTTCETLKSEELWRKLAVEAMKHLEIDLAIRVFKLLDDVSMVWSLESIAGVEDHKLLCGYVAMFLNDFDLAQDWFMGSSYPVAALEMRRDLLQWDQALQLAKKMAPEQIALISREYAQQLEFTGNYSEAHIHYEKGLQEDLSPEHTFICKAGIARTALHCNNTRHGISIALELDNKQLLKECAEILEKNKHLNEAANLFEKCQNYDRAALNYIKLRNWQKIGELLPKITSNKIHLQYAVAKENEGKYEEAVRAYYTAKDYDSVIRLQLEHLNNPEIAVELVQETKSTEGAKLVAKFFQKLNDYTSAIKFLVMSKCNEEAFDLARKHGKMQLYGEILLNTLAPDELRPHDFNSIATHFENERNNLLAGIYWFHAKEYAKAMKHLLKAAKSNSKENEAITAAIDVVASSKNEALSSQLIEFLLGESDGLPKDPKYLFRLYMARKQYKEASKSALIIANEEQINGNYRNAHDVLFAMYQELKQNGIKVPNEMQANLMLLHSYILVRLHVKRGDHLKGARMLIRVANNISKFPSHKVPILTSTVIECHRAGLKHAAFKYATMLMNPEYRKNVDAKYAKKIEAVVRKPPKSGKAGDGGGDPVEPLTPCPYCENLLPETETNCNGCKNNIPFCVVTGRHIVTTDLTACPECDFPALRSQFIEILDSEDSCPMCSEKVDSRRLPKIDDPKPYLNVE